MTPTLATVLAMAPRPRELPGSRYEAEVIGKIFGSDARILTGGQATEDSLRVLAPEFEILHLATFGRLNRANPLFSRMELAPTVDDPGLLAAARADLAAISGTLNTMDDRTAQRLVGAAFAAARRGVVFNFLSGLRDPRWAGRDPSPARRFDPLRWVDFALGLSRRVTFTQGYLDGHDATIFVEQEGPAP